MQPDLQTLLQQWHEGDREAGEQVIALVYADLRGLAAYFLNQERPGHTLQPSDLVNEAYLRLVDAKDVDWRDRAHFFAVSARVMRHILVDHARARRARKRGGDAPVVSFDQELVVGPEPGQDLVALDDALQALAKLDERKSRVIELRFFGGLSVEETATVLKMSPSSVMRDWRLARAWLQREMRGGSGHDDA